MEAGAVAIIDALGFKGIWRRYDPDDVLKTLRHLKEGIEARIKAQFETQPWIHCEVAFLSDTIAISYALKEPIPHGIALSVLSLGDIVSWVCDAALKSKVPLAYRGAIASGHFEIAQHFLIGNAIDDAAEVHSLARGAIIWLTPKARNEVASWLKDQPNNTHMVRFQVPLKGGDSFDTYTVSPFEQCPSEHEADLLSRNLLLSMQTPNIEIATKRQNTIRHLVECYRWRKFKVPSWLGEDSI
jgi:hypothetical protein